MARAPKATNGATPDAPEQTSNLVSSVSGFPSVVTWSPTDELGRTGLVQHAGWVQEEFRPELQGQRGMRIFREMASNDPVIGAILFAIEYLTRQVPWDVEASDTNDPQSQEVADFCSGVMKDLNASWIDVVSEALSMVVFGFAPLEMCFKRRAGEGGTATQFDVTGREREMPMTSRYDDGKLGWAKLAIRSQETVWQWAFDDFGDWQAMSQLPPPDYRVRVIPADKLLLFRTRHQRSNPEGYSLLRNAWRPWMIVRRLQEIEAIGIQRDLVGVPVLHFPEQTDVFNANDPAAVAKLQYAKDMVKRMMVDEQMGVTLPFGWLLELLNSGGAKAINVNEVIVRWDNRIAMTVLADFMLLGQTGRGGNFAMVESKGSTFKVALAGIMDTVKDVVERQGFPRLLALNGWPRELAPTLRHGDVEDEDLAGLAGYVAQLAAAGAPMFPDDELENALRERAKLPLRTGGAESAIKKSTRFRTRETVERDQRVALGAVRRALLRQTDDAGFRRGFEVDRIAKASRSFGYRRPALAM